MVKKGEVCLLNYNAFSISNDTTPTNSLHIKLKGKLDI